MRTYAARLRLSICRSHLINGFELAQICATNFQQYFPGSQPDAALARHVSIARHNAPLSGVVRGRQGCAWRVA